MGLLKGEKIVHKKIRMPGHIPKAVKILEKIGKYEEDIYNSDIGPRLRRSVRTEGQGRAVQPESR